MGDALPAQGAGVLYHADAGAFTGIHQIPDVHILHLVANLDAAHAFYAFCFIAVQRERIVPGIRTEFFGIGFHVYAQLCRNFLQLAVAVSGAGGAIAVMLG